MLCCLQSSSNESLHFHLRFREGLRYYFSIGLCEAYVPQILYWKTIICQTEPLRKWGILPPEQGGLREETLQCPSWLQHLMECNMFLINLTWSKISLVQPAWLREPVASWLGFAWIPTSMPFSILIISDPGTFLFSYGANCPFSMFLPVLWLILASVCGHPHPLPSPEDPPDCTCFPLAGGICLVTSAVQICIASSCPQTLKKFLPQKTPATSPRNSWSQSPPTCPSLGHDFPVSGKGFVIPLHAQGWSLKPHLKNTERYKMLWIGNYKGPSSNPCSATSAL